jgi:Protein of unknown function (DUF3592)
MSDGADHAVSSRKKGGFGSIFGIIVSIFFFLVGVFAVAKIYRLESRGVQTYGQVIGVKIEPAGRLTSSFPLISFKTNDGSTVTFIDRSSTNPSRYLEGEVVDLLYDPDNPIDVIINSIDGVNITGHLLPFFMSTIVAILSIKLWRGTLQVNN